MTTIENTTEDVATQTVREFFSNLAPWTFVRTNETEYVFTGMSRTDDENHTLAPSLVHSFYMAEITLDPETLGDENHWEAMKDGDENKIAEPLVREAIYQMLRARRDVNSYSCEANRLQAIVNDRNAEIASLRTDFATVNDLLGEYAVVQGYCPTYERVIEEWNQKLSVFKLLGRLRDIGVLVQIPFGDNDTPVHCQTYNVVVQARSDEQARQEVSQMSNHDIIKNLVERGCYFDQFTISIEGQQDSDSSDDDDDDDF